MSVGQLVEKDYKVLFENKSCLIDVGDKDILKVKMKGKSIALNSLEEEQIAFSVKENLTSWNVVAKARLAAAKGQEKSTLEKVAIVQKHTNKKTQLREKAAKIEHNEKCLKFLTKNLKAENVKAQSHEKEAIVFQHQQVKVLRKKIGVRSLQVPLRCCQSSFSLNKSNLLFCCYG